MEKSEHILKLRFLRPKESSIDIEEMPDIRQEFIGIRHNIRPVATAISICLTGMMEYNQNRQE